MEIPNFSRYTIDETGKIFDKKLQREVNYYIEKNGYCRIALTKEDKTQKKELIHRLVALTYIPNPENLLVVDHIDNNKFNNHISNLRWSSYSNNSQNYEREKHNVTFDKTKQRWTARRMINGKLIHIGTFKTEQEGIEAVEKFKEDGTKAKTPKSNTGEKNIYSKGLTFYIDITIQGRKVKKFGFKTLEEAIEYRDKNLVI